MKAKIKDRNWILEIVLLSVAVVGLVEIVWLALFGNSTETYTDVILGELATEYGNKSTEIRIYWVGLTIGLVLILARFVSAYKKNQLFTDEKENQTNLLLVLGLGLFIGGQYLFFNKLSIVLLTILLLGIISLIIDRPNVKKSLGLFVCLIYSLTGLFRLYVFIGGKSSVSIYLIIISSFVLSVTFGLFLKKYDSALLYGQIGMPFLFLLFLVDDYIYQGQSIKIASRTSVFILIIAIIIASYIEIGFRIKNRTKNPTSNIASLSIAAMMAFNTFSGAAFVMHTDMHHPAENIISFNEMTNLNQEAFTQYIPVSGLYGWVEGLFLEVFGGGNFVEYSMANNIFYLVIAILLVVAIRQHLDSIWTLILCSLIIIYDYNRVSLIIPFILILLSPRFKDKANFWYMTWVLFGWSYGLYYPAYGVVVIVALLPLAITKLALLKNEWVSSSRKMRIIYGILWAVLLGAIAWSIPLLIGTAKHVLAMGQGMIYVEGVTIFGQALPANFMSYFNTNDFRYTIRLIVGYIIRFSVPMIVIWLGLCGTLCVFKDKKLEGASLKKKIFNLTLEQCSILACLICPFICFKFSLYRMGAGSLFNKATYIIVYSLIMLCIILLEHFNKKPWAFTVIALAVFTCSFNDTNDVTGIENKLYTEYAISDEYTYVPDYNSKLPRLGTGFVVSELYPGLQAASDSYEVLDPARSYYMLYANGLYGMGYDAALGMKGAGLLESMMASSYGAAQENAQAMVNTNAIIGSQISPIDHYYFWKWLTTSGKYIWSDEDRLFHPVTNESLEEIIIANSNVIAEGSSWGAGNYSAALGNSIEDLSEVISPANAGYTVRTEGDDYILEFDTTTNPNTLDFLYLDLDVETDDYDTFVYGKDDHVANNKIEDMLMKHNYNSSKVVMLEWQGNDGVTYSLGSSVQHGKLLIPLGGGIKWLNNYHANLRIYCLDDYEKIQMPQINEMQFYSLRDIHL